MIPIQLTPYQFDPAAYLTEKINLCLNDINADWINIFDQNGYILTKLEQRYYQELSEHRGPWEHSFQKPWFTQHEIWHGPVLNHALLLQRKGFSEAAYEQLEHWAGFKPILWKVAKIRPKWGLDFSIDYTDDSGNVFEILHWEWDAFNFNEVNERKEKYQELFLNWDWQHIAEQMLNKKDQWYNLDFFGQSAWKCNFLGIEHEQFKMVCWK
jgi:hypothetical protein